MRLTHRAIGEAYYFPLAYFVFILQNTLEMDHAGRDRYPQCNGWAVCHNAC
jgi:hypothetical protein